MNTRKSEPLYTCPMCRAGIRDAISAVFLREYRWMGEWSIRYLARLGRVPLGCYREVLREMLRMGLLRRSFSHREDDFPRYLLVPVTAASRKRGDA